MKAESLCIVLMLMNAFQVPTEAQYDTLATGDSLQAWALNHEAHRAWDNNEPDKALFLAQSSIQLFYDDIALAADNYHLVAKLYARKNSTEDAIRYYLRSITAYEKLSDAPRLRNIYTETGDYYFSIGAYVKAPEYYLKASQLADEKEKNKLLIRVGDCYVRSGETAKSSEVYTEVLKNLPDTSQRSRLEILSHLSRNSSQQNSFDEALAYDREILEIFVHLFDTAGISAAYNNIAFDYVNLEKYPDAIGYFNQSLEFGKEQDKGSAEYVQLLINMGVCYQRGNDYDNALQYLLKAYELTGNNPGLSRQRADLENILAITYFYENDLYNAGEYSRRSISSAKSAGDYHLLESCYLTYSQILKAGNDFIRALEFYEMHLAIKDSIERGIKLNEHIQAQKDLDFERTDRELRLKLAEEEMTEIQLKKMKLEAEKREKELDLLKKKRELELSENQRTMQSLLLTQKENEAELRNREIRSLAQDKAIQELQLKEKEAEQRKQEDEIRVLEIEKEKQSEARKRIFYTLILSLLIAILVLVLLVITRRKNSTLAKQKSEIETKNTALEEKNEEILTQTERIVAQKKLIEEKNLSITDSIQYAKRIQEAVLTPVEEIEKYFADCFILFRPRDIVSGDFYWSTRKDHKIIIAAADCTGHGVPGAFMSMLGTTFLSEITSGSKLPDAGSLLDELRKNVIAALRQQGKEGEAQDGMDIALCIIDEKKGRMNFAGANNPLYYVRKGEINIIKGDRMPIGIHINAAKPFTGHNLDIKKDDAFYIFSDGMADQFGGPENKKLKSAAMQQLLVSVSRYSSEKQKELIEKSFDEWKGENEQVDDILLIGFRLDGKRKTK